MRIPANGTEAYTHASGRCNAAERWPWARCTSPKPRMMRAENRDRNDAGGAAVGPDSRTTRQLGYRQIESKVTLRLQGERGANHG